MDRRASSAVCGADVGGPGDGGAATVYVLGAAGLVLAAGLAAAEVGAAVVARHRAGAAADLGALAAASTAARGGPGACTVAGRLVRANTARMAECTVSGAEAIVTATVSPAGLTAKWGTARVSSRAGPADPAAWSTSR